MNCDIKLLRVSGHSGNNSRKNHTDLWNRLTEIPNSEIKDIFESMSQEKILRFLVFMFMTCLHDEELDFSQGRLERFQDILLCCPRNILTEFLRGIREDHDVLTLLEGRNNIWIMFFVGLFELELEDDSVHCWIQHLSEIYQDDFILNLIRLLAREILNQELTPDICQIIYDFVTQFQNMRDESQDSELPPYREVDAEAYVCRTFPLLAQPAPKIKYECGMCYCGPDELNDDKSIRVFRSMPCCEHKQIACHGCLVKWATSCNTPEDPENERKDTNVFICPFSRAEMELFPDENWFNFHQ